MHANHHPIFARAYARSAIDVDRKGGAQHRDELLEGVAGRVIEIGAGTGLNFAHYPRTVTDVVAVEPEPYLRALAEAEAKAAKTGVPIRVVDAVAHELPASDGEYDAGVASLVLCSVDDQARALNELRRVIRPGGELRFYEHVRSLTPRKARMQRAVDVVWPAFGGGCHTSRDTVPAIEAAGFRIDRLRRFSFRPCLMAAPVTPHVIGTATRV